MRLTKTLLSLLFGCLLLAAAAVGISCSSLVATGGGGTEWEAKIVGRVTDSLGVPLADARVILLPSRFNPVTSPAISDSFRDTTNEAGNYSISVAQEGSFSLEIAFADKPYRSLVTGVTISKGDTTIVHDAVARLPGRIRITIPQNSDSAHGYYYIPGTSIFSVFAGHTGTVVLDSVPAGANVSVYYAVLGSSANPQLVRDSITVTSGATLNIAYASWKFSKKLILNTTATGAGVAGTVADFPVLVRLFPGNFDFSAARSGGEDVRFTKSDGTPLPYDIETWDSANSAAVVWVKIDTVYGNNATQTIMMYWGASTGSATASLSDGAAVFTAGAGFQGVWHLGDRTSTAIDATVNNYSGTYSGNLPNRAAGAIGGSQSFDGAGDFADMGNVLNVGSNSFSISAWVKRGNVSTTQAVAGKSMGGGPSAPYGFSFAFYPSDTLNIAVASGGAVFGDSGSFQLKSSVAIDDTTTWHHIVAVVDKSNSSNCKLFIDGIDRSGSARGDIATVGALSNTLPFRLGEAANGDFPFAGLMDEVEMAYTVRSADWIKLEYMNQKAVDALVEFK